MLNYNRPMLADPFAVVQSVLRDFDRLFESSLARTSFPAVNIWQGDDAVALTAELPGVEPGDIEISVKGDILTISGERKAPEVPEDAVWHRRERAYGKFSRSIRLPFPASDDAVEARMSNGVLRIVVARPEEDRPRKIEIKAS